MSDTTHDTGADLGAFDTVDTENAVDEEVSVETEPPAAEVDAYGSGDDTAEYDVTAGAEADEAGDLAAIEASETTAAGAPIETTETTETADVADADVPEGDIAAEVDTTATSSRPRRCPLTPMWSRATIPGPGPASGTSCTPSPATRRRSRPTSTPASSP